MRVLMSALALTLTVAALTGCATAPENIRASYVSEVGYRAWTCEQLGQEQAHLSAALSTASLQQRQARSNDTVGVILLGLPVSSLSGANVAPEIARYKGEQEAVQRSMIVKSCGKQP